MAGIILEPIANLLLQFQSHSHGVERGVISGGVKIGISPTMNNDLVHALVKGGFMARKHPSGFWVFERISTRAIH